MPVIENVESLLEYNSTLISDSFAQMSFQDLTGQRIKRIIKVVIIMEEKSKYGDLFWYKNKRKGKTLKFLQRN